MLKNLAEDANASDPSNNTAVGKDHRAFSALRTAAELVDAVAGWAIDHVYGLSLAGRKMLPRQPMDSRHHPDYVESRAFADDHRHEQSGGRAIDDGIAPTLPNERRLILRNLVFAGAGAFPPWLRQELLEALDALDAGTTMPLLAPTQSEGAKYLKARARLELIAFVRFRSSAYGTTKTDERSAICEATGLSAQTVKGWERELNESCLGALEVHRTLTFATNAASQVHHVAKLMRKGQAVPQIEQNIARGQERLFDSDAFSAAIRKWRRAEGYNG